MPYMRIFGHEFLKNYKSAPSIFLEISFLIQAVDFDIGSACSKGPGSIFSEGLGPGPLYKVCLF